MVHFIVLILNTFSCSGKSWIWLSQFSDVVKLSSGFIIRTFLTSFWFDSDASRSSMLLASPRECEPKANFSYSQRTHSREEVIVKFLVRFSSGRYTLLLIER